MKLLLIPKKLVKLFDFISILFPLDTLNGVKEILYGITGNSKHYLKYLTFT
jgi:hypothetical protein